MAKTLAQFIETIQERIGSTPGIDTQTYLEPRVKLAIQHKFDVLFDEYWWHQFVEYDVPVAVNAVSGSSANVPGGTLKEYRDIHHITDKIGNYAIPAAGMTVARQSQVYRYAIRPVSTAPFFKLASAVSTTYPTLVYITFRKRPNEFVSPNDFVDMDNQLIITGVAYDILEDDGTNPGAADKYKGMFDARLKQLNRAQFQQSPAPGYGMIIPDRWV